MTANRATDAITLRRGLTLAVALLFALEAFPAVWYVNKNAEPGGDGTSWATAFQTIEPAVNAADADGGGEVWIASGVYDEERFGKWGSLEVPSNVRLYGGFSGHEVYRDERDSALHECIIDGSQAWEGASADYVVRLEGPDSRLDGFTVLGGSSGVFAKDANLSNCIVRNNEVPGTRLGRAISAGRSLVEDCIIADNGGAGFSAVSTTIRRCKVTGNSVAIIEGGGLIQETLFENHSNSALTILRDSIPVYVDSCVFRDNVGFRGGAVSYHDETDYCSFPAAPTIFINCVFTNNAAVVNPSVPDSTGVGGAVYVHTQVYNDSCEGEGDSAGRDGLPYPFEPYWPPLFINCTFAGNRALTGGALFWKEGSLFSRQQAEPQAMVIANCIFWDNGPEPIAGEYARLAPIYTGMFTHCLMEYPLTGTSILSQNPLFRDAANGDYRLLRASPAIDFGRDTSGGEYGSVTLDFLGCPRGYDGDGLGAVTGDGSDYDIGAFEYVPECSGEGEGEGETGIHSADQDGDGRINLSELLRIVQFFNAGGFHCADAPAATEDGYLAGSGAAQSCRPHASDYNGGAPDWQIDLTELLRLIQFFSAGGYHWCPEAGTEDGYCPGAG